MRVRRLVLVATMVLGAIAAGHVVVAQGRYAARPILQADVDRLVRVAEKQTGTWPLMPPPPIPEVALVARHGWSVVPRLMVLLSDDPDAERDRRRWSVQQQLR